MPKYLRNINGPTIFLKKIRDDQVDEVRNLSLLIFNNLKKKEQSGWEPKAEKDWEASDAQEDVSHETTNNRM